MRLTGAAITVLVFRLALRLTRDRVRAALISVAALGGLYTLWSERPLLLGVLFLVVLLWVVEVPDCWVGRHPLVVLPVLFWLWANVHGTFALGFAYLGLHLVGRWLDGARPWEGRERQLLVGSAIAFGVTFLNPYGPALVFFPVELMRRGDVLEDVIEWMSPDFHTVRGQSFLLWIAVFVVVIARAPQRVSRRDLVVTHPVPPPRVLGAAQRGDRAARRAPGGGSRARGRSRGGGRAEAGRDRQPDRVGARRGAGVPRVRARASGPPASPTSWRRPTR